MLQKHSALILGRLKSSDVVLDIGGWGHPFNRANWVMDSMPYESRGYYNRTFAKRNPIPPIGGTVEHFTRDTWIERDACEKTPLPFADKQIDYVICSHTLEDIRDPLWVCSEMIRVAKAGYIEVPSRKWETCRGSEPGIAGLSHHRWLIDIADDSVRFIPKFHRIHNWRYSLPVSVLRRMTEEQSVQWLFWTDSFRFSEAVLHADAQLEELAMFVQANRPYSQTLIAMDDLRMKLGQLPVRFVNKAKRTIKGLTRSIVSSQPASLHRQ